MKCVVWSQGRTTGKVVGDDTQRGECQLMKKRSAYEGPWEPC